MALAAFLVGSGLLVAAVLVPTVQQFEFGLPVGIKVTAAVRDRNAELRNAFERERGELELCAQLLSDDPGVAATLVQAAWSQTAACWRRPVTPAIRTFALCTLVHLLAEQDRLRLGAAPSSPESAALGSLAFGARVLIVLHSFVGLNPHEMASLLARSPQEIEDGLRLAESALAKASPEDGGDRG